MSERGIRVHMNIDEARAELAQIIARAMEIDGRLADSDQLSDCPDCPKCEFYREQLAIVLKLLGISVALNGKTQGVLKKTQGVLENSLKQTEEVTLKLNESTGVLEEFIDALSAAMLREAETQGMH